MIFRRATEVPAYSDYEEYRPDLRQDFEYRCAYCLRHEFFFGKGEAGEIDHHRPLTLFPNLINDYGHLYWTCRKCNAVKSGKWPSADQLTQGLRFLEPCAEDHDDHWQARSDGSLVAITPIGNYTIRHIRLDRPTLTQFRRFLYGLRERVDAIETQLHEANLQPETRAQLLRELAALTIRITPPVF